MGSPTNDDRVAIGEPAWAVQSETGGVPEIHRLFLTRKNPDSKLSHGRGIPMKKVAQSAPIGEDPHIRGGRGCVADVGDLLNVDSLPVGRRRRALDLRAADAVFCEEK